MPKVKSAERTFRFLELISNNRYGVTFTDIQNQLNIPKSSAFNLVQEFLENDYIVYNEYSKKYSAGLAYIKLCSKGVSNIDLLQELNILIENLYSEINHVTHAAILSGTNIIYVAKCEHDQNISLARTPGLSVPAHCTSLGKMLLSQYSDEYIRELYKDTVLVKFSENSIDNIDDLIKNLNQIREKGYAIEIREASNFAGCVSLPIYQNSKMVAAFSVTFNAHFLESNDISNFIEIMRKYKEEIEFKIGHIK